MLTVLIAVHDEEEQLARTLASLVAAVAEGTLRDAVILDSGGLPGVAMVADAAGCRRYQGEVAHTLPLALAGTRGHWVLALRPGIVLEAGWHREAAEFIERAESGHRPLCAAFSHASLAYGPVARLGEAWRFVAGNLFGAVSPDQGLIVSRAALGRLPRQAVSTVPPRPPAGGRLVVLRARAFAPERVRGKRKPLSA